jgi:hypothetical protein
MYGSETGSIHHKCCGTCTNLDVIELLTELPGEWNPMYLAHAAIISEVKRRIPLRIYWKQMLQACSRRNRSWNVASS